MLTQQHENKVSQQPQNVFASPQPKQAKHFDAEAHKIALEAARIAEVGMDSYYYR